MIYVKYWRLYPKTYYIRIEHQNPYPTTNLQITNAWTLNEVITLGTCKYVDNKWNSCWDHMWFFLSNCSKLKGLQ